MDALAEEHAALEARAAEARAEAMQGIIELIDRVAVSDVGVLVTGESTYAITVRCASSCVCVASLPLW